MITLGHNFDVNDLTAICSRHFNKTMYWIESENHTSTEDSTVKNYNNNSAPFESIPKDPTVVDHEDHLMFDLLKYDSRTLVHDINNDDDSESDNNEEEPAREKD